MKKEVIICPKCGSTNLKNRYNLSLSEFVYDAKRYGNQSDMNYTFLCKDCNYYGTCPIVQVNMLPKIKKQLKMALKKEKL